MLLPETLLTALTVLGRLGLTKNAASASLTIKGGSSLSADKIWKANLPPDTYSINLIQDWKCHHLIAIPLDQKGFFLSLIPWINTQVAWEERAPWILRFCVHFPDYWHGGVLFFCYWPFMFLLLWLYSAFPNFSIEFFLLICSTFFMPCGCNPLSVMCVANIFSQFCGYLVWTPAYLSANTSPEIIDFCAWQINGQELN